MVPEHEDETQVQPRVDVDIYEDLELTIEELASLTGGAPTSKIPIAVSLAETGREPELPLACRVVDIGTSMPQSDGNWFAGAIGPLKG